LDATHVLLMAGDVPAVNPLSLKDFVDSSLSAKAPLSVLGMEVPEPRGYGRLVSNGDELVKIVEEKDADDETRRITVVSSGVIFAETKLLFELLAELRPNNAQKEFYLTDTIGLCHARGQRPRFYVAKDWQYFSGINDRQQLASVEALIIRRKLEELMHGGVTIRQPASCYIEAKVEVGVDSEISAGVKLYGKTRLGSKCVLEANVVLEQVTCGDGVLIGAGAVLKNCEIARGDIVPPGTVRIGL
jgi:bifunctional UDP-N-acetylglucosamine pyrophosphorylase/glucosamine-1-phosphate N-acetyltransferase